MNTPNNPNRLFPRISSADLVQYQLSLAWIVYPVLLLILVIRGAEELGFLWAQGIFAVGSIGFVASLLFIGFLFANALVCLLISHFRERRFRAAELESARLAQGIPPTR